MPYDPADDAAEVIETLDRIWSLIAEARHLTAYAVNLIENTTEKGRWLVVRDFLVRWERDSIQVAAAFDASPVGAEVIRRAEARGGELLNGNLR